MTMKKDGLNVIPLIDVMLVLLCIVLTTSSFIAQGQIELELPASEATPIQTEQEVKIISVQKDGSLYFENEPVTKEEMSERTKNLPKNVLLKLEIDKEAQFDVFVSLSDILKNNGHDNVAISTLRN